MPKDNPNKYPTRKLQESQGQFTICIPKSLAQAKGWKKGKELTIKLNEKGNIEIFD